MERCFQGPLLRPHHPALKEFKGRIKEKEWATLAFAVPQLIKVAPAFRAGWDKLNYLRRENQKGSHKLKNETQSVVNEADEFAGNPFNWATFLYLRL